MFNSVTDLIIYVSLFLFSCPQRYEAYNSKMSLHDSDLDGTSFKIMHGSDHHENSMGHRSMPKPLLANHGNPFPGQKSSLDRNEISNGEISV